MGSGQHAVVAARCRSDRARTIYAAVDLGTHNCRMLIAEAEAGSKLNIVGALSKASRLGEGLAASGRLCEPAIGRTIEALRLCARRMRAMGVGRARAVGTEACRRAANGDQFIGRVRAETGIELRTISSDEESTLTLSGCAPLLDRCHPRALLFDIGGGSTEVVWVEQQPHRPPRRLASLSLPAGVLTLTEQFGNDGVEPAAFQTMVDTIDAGLAAFDRSHGIGAVVARGGVQMIGTSGTVTTLAAVALGLRRYRRARVDGLDMTFETIAALARELATSDWRARAAIPCIGPARADLIVAGCAILGAIHRRWPAKYLRLADRGIREGLLLRMLAEDRAAAEADAS